MLLEKELGLKAFDFIKEQLAQGGTYAKHLLEIPLDAGDINAFLPPGIPIEQFDDPSGSIQIKSGVSIRAEAKNAVGKMVKRHLRLKPRGCFLTEAFGKPSDSFLALHKLPYVTYQSEFYYLIDRQHARTKTIRKVLGSSRAYPSIFGLSHLPKQGPTIKPGSQLTTKLLNMIAYHTHTIVLGAYDEDSYIVWRAEPKTVST